MSLESQIITRLNAFPAVASLLGTRIYPLILPQNPTLPAAQFNVVDATPRENLFAKAGLYRYEIQIDIFTNTYAEVVTGENVVRLALQGYDNLGSGGDIQAIHHLMSFDDYEKEIANYKKVLRFSVWYGRENP